MKKIIKISLLSILAIIFILLLWNSFVIVLPKSGIVIDEFSNSPVDNISVERIVVETLPGFDLGGGTHEKILKRDSMKTDASGSFSFKSFVALKNPFAPAKARYYFEEDNYSKNDFLPKYNPSFGISSWENKEVRLIPIVANINQCHGNDECINIVNYFNSVCDKPGYQDQVCKAFNAKKLGL